MAQRRPEDSVVHNRVFNHVAISVCNIESVVQWYSTVFGFQLIGEIFHIKRSEQPDSAIFAIYPSSLREVKLGWLTTGNGIGFEVFQFIDPKTDPKRQEFEFQKPGFFHICVTDTNPDDLAKKVESSGGKRIGRTVDPIGTGVKCLYTADPWGNVVEILNVSFDQLACTPRVSPGV